MCQELKQTTSMEPVPFKLDVDISPDTALTESCAFQSHIVTERLPLWLLKQGSRN